MKEAAVGTIMGMIDKVEAVAVMLQVLPEWEISMTLVKGLVGWVDEVQRGRGAMRMKMMSGVEGGRASLMEEEGYTVGEGT